MALPLQDFRTVDPNATVCKSSTKFSRKSGDYKDVLNKTSKEEENLQEKVYFYNIFSTSKRKFS